MMYEPITPITVGTYTYTNLAVTHIVFVFTLYYEYYEIFFFLF